MKRTAFALFQSILFLGLLFGCSEDDVEPGSEGFEISFSPSALEGEVDGEDIDFSVTMIDRATRGAAPPGTVLSLLEQGCFDQATPAIGLFESQADGEDCATALKTIILSTGTITGRFRCRSTGTSLVIAAPPSDGTSSGAATISCVSGPEGDWSFSSIEVTDGELISGGGIVEVSATVVTGTGDPAPSGVRLAGSIVSGESLEFASNSSNRTSTDSSGVAKFRMKTTGETGEVIIRVDFDDARFGEGSERALRVRSPEDPDETQLVVTVRHGNNIVTGDQITVLADGVDQLDIRVELVPSPTAQFDVEGHPIVMKLLEGPGYLDAEGTRELSPLTNNDGLVDAAIFGGASAGTSVLEVKLTDPDPDGEGEELTVQLFINVKALGFIAYQGLDPEVLFVRGGGQNETATARFQVLDTTQVPLVGVEVRFELQNPPSGVSLSPAVLMSDELGMVSTTVQSGTGVGAFSITSRATLGEVVIEAPSPAIPVVGAKPNRRGFTLTCEYKNIGGLRGRQGETVNVDAQWACSSRLVDRFQNAVGVERSIIFLSEGGTIISPQTSAPWNFRANPESPPDDAGTFGAPYSPRGTAPCDTDPTEDEPYLLIDRDDGNCEVQLSNCPSVSGGDCSLNPRDGLVTIVAVTSGEEEFSDANADGAYTEGEAFWDIGEPYVDTNDNNQYDEGEFFIDLAEEGQEVGNNQYDGPNGEWDSDTSIWTNSHILLTSQPHTRAEIQSGEPQPYQRYFYGLGGIWSQDDAPLSADSDLFSLGIVWQDGFLNRYNASCEYSTELRPAVGWSLLDDPVDNLIDQYGFDIDFNSARLGENRNGYVTRMYFENDDQGPVAIGYGHSVQVEINLEAVGLAEIAYLRFLKSCQISQGVGDTLVEVATIPILLPP